MLLVSYFKKGLEHKGLEHWREIKLKTLWAKMDFMSCSFKISCVKLTIRFVLSSSHTVKTSSTPETCLTFLFIRFVLSASAVSNHELDSNVWCCFFLCVFFVWMEGFAPALAVSVPAWQTFLQYFLSSLSTEDGLNWNSSHLLKMLIKYSIARCLQKSD